MDDIDLSEVDNDDLIAELVARDLVGELETETLIDALKVKKGVHSIDVPSSRDYCVAVEHGDIESSCGEVTILIVDGGYCAR